MTPGAHPDPSGTTFAAWSTTAREVEVRLFDESGTRATRTERLDALGAGRFAKHLAGVKPGALYAFVLDGDQVPDPYARYLPRGVDGPARVVAQGGAEALPAPMPLEQWILYELHVGTFSPEGTFRGAEERLDALVELGVTAIELLPVAAFAGERGWGYDGVALYAPFAPYGEPDDLRALVRAAHARGLAVVLDVVYNHVGPAGNYLSRYAPEYFTSAVQTPWGPAPDFAHAPMRSLVLENARYWFEEFGFDGLRLDATHAIHDPSPVHVLRELTELARGMTPSRRVFFEDERNDPGVVRDLGADGVWADDFHHQVHVLLTGERDGYYGAYHPKLEALAHAINEGWTFTGQAFPPWQDKPRGKSPRALGVGPGHLLYCLQNHDQIGNRALGTRLGQDVDLASYCAASMLLLFLPAIPLLFMGQEWASSSPFLFFTDHAGELGAAVRRGRCEEFKSFAAFADPATLARIPDPQAADTFERSRLVWSERTQEPHRRVHSLYRDMLKMRRTDRVLSAPCGWDDLRATPRGAVLEVVRRHGEEERRLVVTFGREEQRVEVPDSWRVALVAGTFDKGRLGGRSAVLLAKEGPSAGAQLQ